MRETIGLILLVGASFSGVAGILLCVWSGMNIERQMGHMDPDTYRRMGLGIKLLIAGAILGVSGYLLSRRLSMLSLDFIREGRWLALTGGIGGALGFAFLINLIRLQPDAQLPNRQVAGWIMIVLALAVAIALTIYTFMSYGRVGGFSALLGASFAAGVLVLLSLFR